MYVQLEVESDAELLGHGRRESLECRWIHHTLDDDDDDADVCAGVVSVGAVVARGIVTIACDE